MHLRVGIHILGDVDLRNHHLNSLSVTQALGDHTCKRENTHALFDVWVGCGMRVWVLTAVREC